MATGKCKSFFDGKEFDFNEASVILDHLRCIQARPTEEKVTNAEFCEILKMLMSLTIPLQKISEGYENLAGN